MALTRRVRADVGCCREVNVLMGDDAVYDTRYYGLSGNITVWPICVSVGGGHGLARDARRGQALEVEWK